AGEHHVPYPAVPAAEVAVTGVPLLLGNAGDLAGDLAVGDVTAAREAVARRGQGQAAVDVHPAERTGLGHGPPSGSGRRGDLHVLRGPPEVLGGVAGAVERVHGDVTVVRDVVRVLTETLDRGVVADVRVHGVGTRLEQQRVPLGAELVDLLGVEHVVQR